MPDKLTMDHGKQTGQPTKVNADKYKAPGSRSDSRAAPDNERAAQGGIWSGHADPDAEDGSQADERPAKGSQGGIFASQKGRGPEDEEADSGPAGSTAAKGP